ncbi:hypothetical protein [Sphaerochaeta sp. S2]|uniref:hypothetical protein n=1 Tax=Sphaerochaeta sp. S2 TaxID=2798868 RepID=UPI0018EA28DC|nr:hypothetical protein [Sphaerochaeta sp. S2]MBJ2356997.1 hypothetical protein [Sphaerochaeta sp. S2]
MLFIDESTIQELTVQDVLAYAKDSGVSVTVMQQFLTLVEGERTTYAIAVLKAVSLLQEVQIPVATHSLQAIVRVSKLKFHGTDGVRGVVVPAQETVALDLLAYQEHGLLSPNFCYLLVKAFLVLAREHGQGGNLHLAIAEDGRDYTSGRALVRSVAAAARDTGYVVDYLGILPTPGVAAYSLIHNQLAVMITASHNPAKFNGIKCFIQGKKLYPEGVLGEYAISEQVFAYALQSPNITLAPVPDVRQGGSNVLSEIILNCMTADDTNVLGHCSITIDCANGAVSQCYQEICDSLKLSYDVVNDSVNPGTINKGCGAAVLEQYFQIPSKPPYLTSLIERMVEKSKESQVRQYGLAVDGDGDRCMVVVLEPNAEYCTVLHGDEQILLLSERFTAVQQLAITIESDPGTKAMLSSRFPERMVHVKGVGDRYLRYGMEDSVLLGAEDSGHVIFPVPMKDGSCLYSGNGLLTGLLVIGAFHRGLTMPFVRLGVHKTVVRPIDRKHWYEGSPLYEEMRKVLTRELLDMQLVRFPEDMDMLVCSYDTNSLLYIRASGTEPKMQFVCPDVPDLRLERVAQAFKKACAPYQIQEY